MWRSGTSTLLSELEHFLQQRCAFPHHCWMNGGSQGDTLWPRPPLHTSSSLGEDVTPALLNFEADALRLQLRTEPGEVWILILDFYLQMTAWEGPETMRWASVSEVTLLAGLDRISWKWEKYWLIWCRVSVCSPAGPPHCQLMIRVLIMNTVGI